MLVAGWFTSGRSASQLLRATNPSAAREHHCSSTCFSSIRCPHAAGCYCKQAPICNRIPIPHSPTPPRFNKRTPHNQRSKVEAQRGIQRASSSRHGQRQLGVGLDWSVACLGLKPNKRWCAWFSRLPDEGAINNSLLNAAY